MFKFRRASVTALAAAAAVPGLLTVAAVPASAAPAPYTIALITSVTGEAAPQDVGTVGAFKARLDFQNAQGGIDGHKLVPLIIDDQTSPTAISTAIQDAISKGAIGIVSESPVLFLAAKVAATAGIPVTGDDSDGPEWGQPGYTNMFAAVYGSLNPSYPVNTVYGQLLKTTGATKLATYAIGISPDSVRANSDVAQSFARLGGQTPVNDSTIPFGSVNFTTPALAAKNAGVNALWPNLDSASDVALTQAYKQAGIKTKAIILPAGLSPSLIKSPAWPALQGVIFLDEVHPFQVPDAGTKAMQAALEKYDGYTPKDFPKFFRIQCLARSGSHDQGDRERWIKSDSGLRREARSVTSRATTATACLPTPSISPRSTAMTCPFACGRSGQRRAVLFQSKARPTAARTSRGRRQVRRSSDKRTNHECA